jgi:hypothetical protein
MEIYSNLCFIVSAEQELCLGAGILQNVLSVLDGGKRIQCQEF